MLDVHAGVGTLEKDVGHAAFCGPARKVHVDLAQVVRRHPSGKEPSATRYFGLFSFSLDCSCSLVIL
jgi:hypothetical protein